jgi:predicted ATPase
MIFEDAHWTDPTSLELFCRIVDKIPILRVLLIVTFPARVRAALDRKALRDRPHHQSAGRPRKLVP